MTIVKDIITDALEDLVSFTEGETLKQSEAIPIIRTLNQMMAMWSSRGVNIGWTNVSKISDIVTIPDGALLGVISNLAVRLAPKYLTGEIPKTLVMAANEGYKTVVHIACNPTAISFPDTLPVGSGNETDMNQVFYDHDPDQILSEQNGAIAVEDNTEV